MFNNAKINICVGFGVENMNKLLMRMVPRNIKDVKWHGVYHEIVLSTPLQSSDHTSTDTETTLHMNS